MWTLIQRRTLAVAVLFLGECAFGAIHSIFVAPTGAKNELVRCSHSLAIKANNHSEQDYFNRDYLFDNRRVHAEVLEDNSIKISDMRGREAVFEIPSHSAPNQLGVYLLANDRELVGSVLPEREPIIAVTEPSVDGSAVEVRLLEIPGFLGQPEKVYAFSFSAKDLPMRPQAMFKTKVFKKAEGYFGRKTYDDGEITLEDRNAFGESYTNAVMGEFKLDLKAAHFFRVHSGPASRTPKLLIPVYFDLFFDIKAKSHQRLYTRHYLLVDWQNGAARLTWVPFSAHLEERSILRPTDQTHAMGFALTTRHRAIMEEGDLGGPIPFRSRDGKQHVVYVSSRGLVSVFNLETPVPELVAETALGIPQFQSIYRSPLVTPKAGGLQLQGVTDFRYFENLSPTPQVRKHRDDLSHVYRFSVDF